MNDMSSNPLSLTVNRNARTPVGRRHCFNALGCIAQMPNTLSVFFKVHCLERQALCF